MTQDITQQEVTMERAGELMDKLTGACSGLDEVAKTLRNQNLNSAVVRSGLDSIDQNTIAALGNLHEQVTIAANYMQDIGLLTADDAPYAGKDVGAACDLFLK